MNQMLPLAENGAPPCPPTPSTRFTRTGSAATCAERVTTMRKRIILGSVAIVGCLALVAIVISLWDQPYINGGGGLSLGQTSIQYLQSGNEISLVIWADNTGASESNSESSLTSGRA